MVAAMQRSTYKSAHPTTDFWKRVSLPTLFFFLTRGRVGKLQVFEHWGEFSLLYRRCMEGELRVGNGDGSVHKHG